MLAARQVLVMAQEARQLSTSIMATDMRGRAYSFAIPTVLHALSGVPRTLTPPLPHSPPSIPTQEEGRGVNTGTTKVGVRGAENQGGGAHRVQVDQGAKLGVANARNAANSAEGHRSYALADTESDSHKEETISKTSASLHVGWIRVGCFLLWSVWE